MQLVLNENNKVTSLQLLDQVNFFRDQDGKKHKLHKDLLKGLRDEFEDEISERKISPSEYVNERGKKFTMFELTIDEAKQLMARESKIVRKAIIKKLSDIENELNTKGYIISDNINNIQVEEAKNVLNIKELINDVIAEDITVKKFKETIGDYFKKIKDLKIREREVKKMNNKFQNSELSVELSSSINKYLLALQKELTKSMKRSRGQKNRHYEDKINKLTPNFEYIIDIYPFSENRRNEYNENGVKNTQAFKDWKKVVKNKLFNTGVDYKGESILDICVYKPYCSTSDKDNFTKPFQDVLCEYLDIDDSIFYGGEASKVHSDNAYIKFGFRK